MLDWHSCQICYPLEIKILLLLLLALEIYTCRSCLSSYAEAILYLSGYLLFYPIN